MKQERDVIKMLDQSMESKTISSQLIDQLKTLQKANEDRIKKYSQPGVSPMTTAERDRIQQTQNALNKNIPLLDALKNKSELTVKELTTLIEFRQSLHTRPK
jgi:hypothetical protein